MSPKHHFFLKAVADFSSHLRLESEKIECCPPWKRRLFAHKNPHGFVVNSIKMVDFPWLCEFKGVWWNPFVLHKDHHQMLDCATLDVPRSWRVEYPWVHWDGEEGVVGCAYKSMILNIWAWQLFPGDFQHFSWFSVVFDGFRTLLTRLSFQTKGTLTWICHAKLCQKYRDAACCWFKICGLPVQNGPGFSPSCGKWCLLECSTSQ